MDTANNRQQEIIASKVHECTQLMREYVHTDREDRREYLKHEIERIKAEIVNITKT